MPTLVLSTWSLPASQSLADVARQSQWDVFAFDEKHDRKAKGKLVFYGGTDLALKVAACHNLALLEPPLDLLARLPLEFRQRAVEIGQFSDLRRLKSQTFVKPADALHKSFDAGIYSDVVNIRTQNEIDPQTPVLVAEPVQWSAEYRCFVLEGEIAAWSPYLSFGRPVWKPFGQGGHNARVPDTLLAFCKRLFSRSRLSFPPAFVMDVGLIEDRGWAVVEFNPAWCSGLLGSDPRNVLAVLERACQDLIRVTEDDQRWVIHRSK